MSIPLHISPRLIPSIASLYNNVNRIFMEYIDNSIDSAEQFYDKEKNSYSRPIEIILRLEGNSYNNGSIIILDNCFGITNFTKVVQSIGNSDKKADFITNGQFGYGIYSFMASCSKLEITSKTKKENALYIPIEKKQFDTDKQENVSFPDPKIAKMFEYETGTKICLSHFDKYSWRQIDIQELQNEIESHFELLLTRKNFTIKIIRGDNILLDTEEFVCKPFDYGQYEGEIWEDYLKELSFVKGRKSPHEVRFPIQKPIHIFIKVTKGKEINKRPVFICKGRRISEVKDIRSFRSAHKSELWDHPNVTGYIDLLDFLEPTIARNDFTNSEKSKALFSKLIEIEPLILDVVKDVNKTSEERHYQELEDRLNQALSKLARLDSMNYRTDYLSGNIINLEKGGTGQGIEGNNGEKDHGGTTNTTSADSNIGENEGKGKGIGENSGNIPGGDAGGEAALNKEAENPFEDTGFKGGEKKKSGFNVRIDERPPDIDSMSDKPLRSNLYGSEIRIFKQHPDFQERVEVSRRGETRITQRLITYLAGEITVHYKDKFHTKQKEQPEYNKNMFTDLVGFIYQFEEMLKDLSGKNLSDLSS